MTKYLMKLWSEQEGQSLPEFTLLMFLLSLTAVSAMGGVAKRVNHMYSNVSTHVASAGAPALTGGASSVASAAPAETQIESMDPRNQKPSD